MKNNHSNLHLCGDSKWWPNECRPNCWQFQKMVLVGLWWHAKVTKMPSFCVVFSSVWSSNESWKKNQPHPCWFKMCNLVFVGPMAHIFWNWTTHSESKVVPTHCFCVAWLCWLLQCDVCTWWECFPFARKWSDQLCVLKPAWFSFGPGAFKILWSWDGLKQKWEEAALKLVILLNFRLDKQFLSDHRLQLHNCSKNACVKKNSLQDFFQKFVTHNKMKQWTHILVAIKVRQLLTTLFWAWACLTGLHSCCLGDDSHQCMWKQCQQCIDCTFLMWVCCPFPMRAKAARARKSVEKAQMQGSKLWSAETKNSKNDTISTKLWENITSPTKPWPKCKGRTILWTAKIPHKSSWLQTHAPSLHSPSNIQWQSEAMKWLVVKESNSCKFPHMSLWNVSFRLVNLQQKIEVPLSHCFDVQVGFG